eukprot:5654330-Alexandrium_andersonii.AAC.1
MKNINAMNFDAPATSPQPSVPGRVTSETSKAPEVEKQQRGAPNSMGDDSNSQSNADKEFSRYYFGVDPEDFAHALGS